MSAASLRAAIPLSIFTAVGLLATDLYLPAVPSLPAEIGGTVPQAQATLAVFLASLALSQLLWGVAADRFGAKSVLKLAIGLQIVAGMACAVAPSMTALIVGRAFQGLGVGAATVVVPSLIRQQFSDRDTVRAMSWLGIAEGLIPAIGPIVGTALLSVADWRASFWIVAVMALVLTPFALRSVPEDARNQSKGTSLGYTMLLRDRAYLGYALGHALCFAALLTFVASAPQIVQVWLRSEPQMFAILQALGVSAFAVSAWQSGRLTDSFGIDRLIAAGVTLQVLATAAMLGLAFAEYRSATALIATWVLFCGALGLRGPATMARALDVAPELVGRASGLLMFLALGLAAGGTQVVAPFLVGGLLPVAVISVGYTLASAVIILTGQHFRAKNKQRQILRSFEG
ncbi:MFS transporter [Agrobacterium sp. NPDC089420]|uniref:MFS transporter n=1 Tax=Agrobacterium sp. NPDC089420 TaxID=3363918 RepID=UPI0038503153